MKSISFTFALLTSLLLFLGCSSDSPLAQLEGSYEGTFTVVYGNAESFSNPVEVTIGSGRFSSSTGPNRVPAGGAGTYEVVNSTIDFTDEGAWTADFDWNLILNGAYTYSLNGNTLTLSAEKNNVGTYIYELRKN